MTPDEQQTAHRDGAPPAAPPAATRRRAGTAPRSASTIPEDALILITTRNLVLFPGTVLPMTLGRQRSVVAAQTAIRLSRPVGLVLQRDPSIDAPMPVDLHRVGTEANLLRYVTSPDGSHHVICQGERRFRITEFLDGYPFFVARVERIAEVGGAEHRDRRAAAAICATRRSKCCNCCRRPRPSWSTPCRASTSAPALADLIASFMDITPAEKQEILETFDIERRLERVSELLSYRLEVLRLSRQISDRTKETMDERQREFLLREQLKTIQKELGEGEDAKSQEIAELRREDRRGENAGGGRGARQEGAGAARTHAGSGRRIFDGAHLSRMADRTALDGRGRGADRHRRGAPRARRGPLRAAEDQAPHPRISRDPQAEPERPQPDPVLCRAARGRQDLARPEHRARDGAQIRPGQPRRHARRGRDPRPPPHLYRRACPATSCRASAAPAAGNA